MSAILAFYSYLLSQHVNCQCQRILPIRQHVSCWNAITDTISVTETHYYQLSVNESYDINFDSCISEIDVIVVVEDVDGNDISGSYCDQGNACGSCNNHHNYIAENFTMPAIPLGTYFIKIASLLAESGPYHFQIKCIGSMDNISHNDTHLTNTPNPTLAYTMTSVPAAFYRTDDCDYFSDNIYSVSDSQSIRSLIIKDDSITVAFDIKLNEYCNSALCNILYIVTADCMESLSLSINGIKNYFEISIVSEYDYHDVYRIPDANVSLPIDDRYHAVYLLFMYASGDHDHHPNVFTIDNFTHHYYSTSLTPSNTRYQLYISNPWDDTTNADISNICIHSLKYNNDYCDVCDGEIQCGETQTSQSYPVFNPLHSNYLYFNLSKQLNGSYVMFDSCGSYLYLYDIRFNMLYEGNNGGDVHCVKGKLMVPLYAGEYILSISGSYSDYPRSQWQLRVLCFHSLSHFETNKHPYTMWYDIWSTSEWWEMESTCEQVFGTSLATIITEQDVMDALDLIRMYDTTAQNISAWIGMYKLPTNSSNWRWISGTPCKYSLSGNCTKDINWRDGEPDNMLYDGLTHRKSTIGTYLKIQDDGNDYWILDEDPNGEKMYMLLCNAPNGRYAITSCTNHENCWFAIAMHGSNLTVNTSLTVYDDTWKEEFRYRPPIAYWKSKLFIIGYDEIYYVTFGLFDHQYEWKSKVYNQNKTYRQHAHSAPWYAQDGPFLYLYSEENTYYFGDDSNAMLQINLETLDVRYYVAPETSSDRSYNWYETEYTYCMVAGNNVVYLVRNPHILAFDTRGDSWNASRFSVSLENKVDVCVMNTERTYIYLFDWFYQITIKYDIHTGLQQQWKDTGINVCISGSSRERGIVAIAARDNKIYFHGCYIASWKTLIFD
eukprot:823256_1